ncbi:MAG: hypothetical protein ABEL51_00740 [Salinibacter sp.]
MGWLFLGVAVHAPVLLYPYTIAYAAFVAVIGIEHTERFHELEAFGLDRDDVPFLVGITLRKVVPFLLLLWLGDGVSVSLMAPLEGAGRGGGQYGRTPVRLRPSLSGSAEPLSPTPDTGDAGGRGLVAGTDRAPNHRDVVSVAYCVVRIA